MLMQGLKRWIARHHGAGRLVATRRRPSRFRHGLEVLENRAVPAVFTVNTATDAGPLLTGEGADASGDLRYCIAQADNAPGADTIAFALAAYSVIRLSQMLRPITDPGGLTIRGETAANLTISGDANDSGVNDAGDVRVFFVMNQAATWCSSGVSPAPLLLRVDPVRRGRTRPVQLPKACRARTSRRRLWPTAR